MVSSLGGRRLFRTIEATVKHHSLNEGGSQRIPKEESDTWGDSRNKETKRKNRKKTGVEVEGRK